LLHKSFLLFGFFDDGGELVGDRGEEGGFLISILPLFFLGSMKKPLKLIILAVFSASFHMASYHHK